MDVPDWPDGLAGRLLAQRIVLLHGPLDAARATRVAAELMTLDAEGDSAVSLRIDCAEGSVAQALVLMDVIELLGVPVRGLGLGQVGGAAVGVLAVCAHRSALPNTRFILREPATSVEAPARQVTQWVQLHRDERTRFAARIAAASRRPTDAVAEDFARGVFLDAPGAVDYGLLDEICRPSGDIRPLTGPPIGFRPRR